MKKYALDIDDVLAGYAIGVHNVFLQEIKPHNHWAADESTGLLILSQEPDKVYVDEYMALCNDSKVFWKTLIPISKPVDINFEVSAYITSSPLNMISYRNQWLRYWGFPLAPVYHSKDKPALMHQLGITTLIDDKLDTIHKVRKAGLEGIHFQPWYSTLREEDSITNLSQIS